ncbi:MAG: hypothetical protein LH632_15655, partial [Rhodoferax sp.]|nr:hypothetical protein [Rhodoferax sp.]
MMLPRRAWVVSAMLALAELHAPAVNAQTAVTARPADSFSAAVANEWFGLALQLTQQTPGFSAPVASRGGGPRRGGGG